MTGTNRTLDSVRPSYGRFESGYSGVDLVCWMERPMSEYHEFENSTEHEGEFEANTGSQAEPQASTPPESEGSSECNQHEQDHRNRSEEVLDLIAGVERQLEHMRNAQSACVDEIESLEDRKKHISEREKEISDIGDALAERQTHLDEHKGELEQAQRELEASRDQVNRKSEELSEREVAVEERTRELDGRFSEFEAKRSEYEQAQAQLQADRQSFSSEQESLNQERDRLSSELQEAKARAEQADSRCNELSSQHSELVRQIESSSSNLQEAQTRAAQAEEAIEKVQAESIDLARKLEEAASVIERRDFELDEARTEAAASNEVQNELRSEIATREGELNDLQSSFDIATERLQSLANAVAEQAPRLEEGAAAAALCRQHEAKITSLKKELEEAQARATSSGESSASDAQIAAIREDLELARMELEDSIPLDEHQRVVSSLEAQVSAGCDGETTEDRALRAEFSQVVAELKSVQAHAEGCESAMRTAESQVAALQERNEELERMCEAVSEDMPEDAVRLREQAQRLSSFAVHLQRRRGRLRNIRNMLRERKSGESGAFEAIEADREYKAHQEDLLRRRHELTDLESKMVRRWARHGTVGTVLRVVFLVAILGAVSWLSVRWFMPGVVSATTLVRAQPVAGGVVDDSRATAWNDWHSSIITDKLFAQAVAARLAASPAGYSGNVDSIQSALQDDLQVDAVQPGMLQFRLYGTSRNETVRELEAIVSTLSAESQRQLPRRGDGARAEILSNNGNLVSLDPVEVSGAQVQTAGMVFGGALACVGLLGAAIYTRLSRSRRIFDENVGFDEVEID